MNQQIILTGPPSSGKSSVLEELAEKHGFYSIDEVATYVIERELKKDSDVLPWKDPEKFQKKVLETQLEWEKGIEKYNVKKRPVVLDRGTLDGIAYLKVNKMELPEEFKNLPKNGYTKIFMFEQLPTFEETEVRRDKHLKDQLEIELEKVYRENGYEVVRVPVMPIKERTEYILKHM